MEIGYIFDTLNEAQATEVPDLDPVIYVIEARRVGEIKMEFRFDTPQKAINE